MTLPGYDIKHVKASHRKYQIITIFLTIITLSATLGAAFSGIRLSSLKKEIPESTPPKAPVISDDSAMKEIEALKSALSREKSTSLKMKAKIKDLNNQISALKKAAATPKASKPTAPQAVQPKPAAAPLPPQQKESATGSAPTPRQPAGASEGINPPADSTTNPNAPGTETATPSVETNEDPVPSPETKQPPSVPPVKAPSVQPQSETAPSNPQQSAAKNE